MQGVLQQSFKQIVAKIGVLVAVLAIVIGQQLIWLPKVWAATDVCTWTGSGADSNWTTAANWNCATDGVAAPEDGDSLIFPDGASRKTNVNDFADLDVESVTYSGDSYSNGGMSLTISPNAGSLAIYFSVGADFNNHGVPTVVVGNESKSIASEGTDNIVSNSLDIELTDGGDMNFFVTLGQQLDVTANISGSLDVFIIGPFSNVLFSGINTFDRNAVIISNTGIFDCSSTSCLGNDSSSDTLTLYRGSQLYLNASITMTDSIDVVNVVGEGNAQIWAAVDAIIDGDLDIGTNLVIGAQNDTLLSMTGSMNFNTNSSVQFQGGNSASLNQFVIDGTISGDGPINIADAWLRLNADNGAFAGQIDAQEGAVVQAAQDGSLGNVDAPTVVHNGATYFTDANFENHEPLTITGEGEGTGEWLGAIANIYDSHVELGTITLDGDATVYNAAESNTLSLRGVITGTGDLTLQSPTSYVTAIQFGDSGLSLDDQPNTYSGKTIVNNALILLNKNDGVVAIPGDLEVNAHTDREAKVYLNNHEQIADDAIVTLNQQATDAHLYVVADGVETIGALEGDGIVHLGTSAELYVGGGDQSGTFTGSVHSADTVITKIGSGTWNMNGVNYDGGSGFARYDVQDGTLSANFADTSAVHSVFNVVGGSLKGTGVLGAITVSSGSLAPGNSPGCMNPDGDVALEASTTLSIELQGTTACDGYDAVNATGVVTIQNAQLTVASTINPAVGTVFTIIQADSVVGTFAGLVNGATLMADGKQYRVTYTATTVTLTYLGQVATGGSLGETGQQVTTTAGLLLISALGALWIAQRRRKLIVYRNN